MELQKTKHEIKLAEWREMVQDCRGSGMRIRDCCASRGISEQNYYRWQRQVWEAGVEHGELGIRASNAVFAEYVPLRISPSPNSAAVVVHLNCGRVEIQNGADLETIENTLSVLQKLC